jgi:hypothetical protein
VLGGKSEGVEQGAALGVGLRSSEQAGQSRSKTT